MPKPHHPDMPDSWTLTEDQLAAAALLGIPVAESYREIVQDLRRRGVDPTTVRLTCDGRDLGPLVWGGMAELVRPDVVPYTDSGERMVAEAVRRGLGDLIAPDTFKVTIPPQTAEDQAARVMRGVSFEATLAGTIEPEPSLDAMRATLAIAELDARGVDLSGMTIGDLVGYYDRVIGPRETPPSRPECADELPELPPSPWGKIEGVE